MSKAPRVEYQAQLRPGAVRGAVMAYAGSSEGVRGMAEAMSRFQLTREELAGLLDCPADALRTANIASEPEVVERLNAMLEVLDRLSEWTKSDRAAMAWYVEETIPAFGNVTASALVAEGRGAAVVDYLGSLAFGGFA